MRVPAEHRSWNRRETNLLDRSEDELQEGQEQRQELDKVPLVQAELLELLGCRKTLSYRSVAALETRK